MIFADNVLKGKVAFVVGGTRGFNLSIAKCYGQYGASVAVMSRDEGRVADAVKELEALGIPAMGMAGDVRDYDRMVEITQAIADKFGKLDIVIAGQAGNFYAPAIAMSTNAFKSVIDIDLVGTFNVFKASFDHLSQPGASLIAITAPEGVNAMPFQTHACSAKAGVNMLTKVLAIEWGPVGIRVNGISPGPIEDTFGMDHALGIDETMSEQIRNAVPLKRWGTHEDVANAALFLATDAASYVTGTILDVEGGVSIVSPGAENSDAINFADNPMVKGKPKK